MLSAGPSHKDCHAFQLLTLKNCSSSHQIFLNKSVDNITAFQVNPEPSVSKGWLVEWVGRGRVCCWGEGGKLLLFTAGPVPGLPASPGALLTGESSSRAGFQAGDHQIQITSAPQLSTEARVPAGFKRGRSFLQEIST